MSFDAQWLNLRRTADDRARSAVLIDRAAARLASRAKDRKIHIVDLGAGTGATMRALSVRFAPSQRWTLIDADPGLLAHAASERPDVEAETLVADLACDPLPVAAPIDLVTASALFDLTSARFIEALADALATAEAPLLAMLSYDGELSLDPPHAYDGVMVERFNAHQRGEKGFGPAVGPDAAALLQGALDRRGFATMVRKTPWLLERERDGLLMATTLSGWAGAAKAIAPESQEAVEGWLTAHLANAKTLQIGHRDVYAEPPV